MLAASLMSTPSAPPVSSDSLEWASPSLYLNRELSWLAFNERVLDQAADERWPLLERCKFLAIFGSNLDEFFMIRVSGLHEQLESRVPSTAPDGLSPVEQLARIRTGVTELVARASALWAEVLAPALGAVGIRIASFGELSEAERAWGRTLATTRGQGP